MKTILFLAFLFLGGCGYSSRDSEMTGQIKKVVQVTPIICPDRHDIDISLGVIRGGVGSMSAQDEWLTVVNDSALAVLKEANETGALVKIIYSKQRVAICQHDLVVTHAEFVK